MILNVSLMFNPLCVRTRSRHWQRDAAALREFRADSVKRNEDKTYLVTENERQFERMFCCDALGGVFEDEEKERCRKEGEDGGAALEEEGNWWDPEPRPNQTGKRDLGNDGKERCSDEFHPTSTR